MLLFRLFFLLSFCLPLDLFSIDTQSNVLIYTDPVQISSEINQYEQLVAGTPIQGSVMVTHDAKNAIDPNSFRLGNKLLSVEFVQSVPMSDYSNLVVTIYKFRLDGMKKGIHTLPPIKVKVGGKEYQAPPLTLEIGS